jgi:outer membrane protein assembly factor BamB
VLIDMEGNELYRWQRTFREIWPKAAHVPYPRSPELIVYNNARVFPNGDLIVQFRGDGGNPWGYGLVKLDKDSNVIWKLSENAHHFFDVDAEGNVYAITHVNRDSTYEPSKALKFGAMSKPYKINLPVLEDFIVILAPDGSVKKRISLLDAFVDSPYEAALTYFGAGTDVLHTNDINVVSKDMVENPVFKPGQALISMRDPGVLAVLDLETGKIVWAKRGAWRGQHDPNILPDGNVLMVDNLGALSKGGRTRIIEIKPDTGEVVWDYHGDEEHPLDTRYQSTAQRLPNGNTLITEWEGGRMLEVTKEGDSVWEYVVPVRRRNKDMEFQPVINAGQRIRWDQLHFLKH